MHFHLLFFFFLSKDNLKKKIKLYRGQSKMVAKEYAELTSCHGPTKSIATYGLFSSEN